MEKKLYGIARGNMYSGKGTCIYMWLTTEEAKEQEEAMLNREEERAKANRYRIAHGADIDDLNCDEEYFFEVEDTKSIPSEMIIDTTGMDSYEDEDLPF